MSKWLILPIMVLSGCRVSMEAKSAGQIGCPSEEITIETLEGDYGMGQSTENWRAKCRGRSFMCNEIRTGNGGPSEGAHSQVSCREEIGTEPDAQASAASSGTAVSTPPVSTVLPTAVAGFTFGADAGTIQKSCETAGHRWTMESPDVGTCSGPASDLGFPAQVALHFRNKNAAIIQLTHTPEDKWLASVATIREALTQKYGEPKGKRAWIPNACQEEAAFARCLQDGSLRLSLTWRLARASAIELTVGKPVNSEDGPAAVRILYKSGVLSPRADAL